MLILLFIFSHVKNDADRLRLLVQKEIEGRSWALPSRFIIREDFPKNDFGWLVTETISEYFRGQGKTVYYGSKKENTGVLTLRVVNLKVEYNKTPGVFSKKIERTIKGEIYLTFVDSTGVFKWLKNVNFGGVDTIKISDLKDVYVNGLSPEFESSKSILKPLLATLFVGAVIVALYTIGY